MREKPVQLMWLKFQAYKNGISPSEFNKQSMRDILDMADIDSACEFQGKRMATIQAEMNKLMQM